MRRPNGWAASWRPPAARPSRCTATPTPGNLVATRDGLVWIDFEEVCRGPVEWDLATMLDPDAVAAHHRPDPAVLARCTELRSLQVALCLLAALPSTPPDRPAEGG